MKCYQLSVVVFFCESVAAPRSASVAISSFLMKYLFIFLYLILIPFFIMSAVLRTIFAVQYVMEIRLLRNFTALSLMKEIN